MKRTSCRKHELTEHADLIEDIIKRPGRSKSKPVQKVTDG